MSFTGAYVKSLEAGKTHECRQTRWWI